MGTVRIVLGRELLKAADRAAKRQRVNRSTLVREALCEHLKRLAAEERQERDRSGYESRPAKPGEFSIWDEEAGWPDE